MLVRWFNKLFKYKLLPVINAEFCLCTVVKDDQVNLPWWVEHHGKMVGVNNLIIYDAGTTDTHALWCLRQAERKGVTIIRVTEGLGIRYFRWQGAPFYSGVIFIDVESRLAVVEDDKISQNWAAFDIHIKQLKLETVGRGSEEQIVCKPDLYMGSDRSNGKTDYYYMQPIHCETNYYYYQVTNTSPVLTRFIQLRNNYSVPKNEPGLIISNIHPLVVLRVNPIANTTPVNWDPVSYLSNNPDVRPYMQGPLHHFIKYGYREDRKF